MARAPSERAALLGSALKSAAASPGTTPDVARASRLRVLAVLLASLGAVACFAVQGTVDDHSPAAHQEASADVQVHLASTRTVKFNVTLSPKCQLCAEGLLVLQAPSAVDATVGLRFRKSDDSEDDWMWATSSVGVGDLSVAIEFCRMRFRSTYLIEVYMQTTGTADEVASLVAVSSVSTGSLGFDTLDLGTYATVKGEASWSSGLVFTYTAATANLTDQSVFVDDGVDVFSGIVAIDADGYVVWYYRAPFETGVMESEGETYYLVFDWLPSSYNLAVTRYVGNFFDLTPVTLGDVQVITPLGERVGRKYTSTCEGNTSSFNQVQHECRVDRSDSSRGYPILTFEYRESSSYGQWDDLLLSNNVLAESWHDMYMNDSVSYIGDRLVRWDWDSDASGFENTSSPTVLYDLFDYLTPAMTKAYELPGLTSMSTKCDGGTGKFGVDYHHGSAINVGLSDDYLVTLRNMDMLMSFARDGSGLNWAISPSIANESTLAFANREAEFYAPHDITQISQDRFLLMDDGNSRPNCSTITYQGCFSRAVEIWLDWDAGLVRCTWQFAFPNSTMIGDQTWAAEASSDVFNDDGGSVEILDNGNYLVAFTKLLAAADDYSGDGGRAYEVDSSGSVVSMMVFPNMPSSYDNAGHYRVLSAGSIFGETSSAPFYV